LLRIAEGLGFDGPELIALAREERAHKEFETYTIDAQRRGVFGSPFYFYGGEIFWGQDRLDFLEGLLAGAGTALVSHAGCTNE
jgi:2-hydroxychromene-2-carboxylate isomerase